MHRRTRVSAPIVSVLVAVMLAAGAGPAAAASPPVDDSAYTEEQKATAEEQAAEETADRTCDMIATGLLSAAHDGCVNAMKSEFTREAMPTLAAATLCAVLGPALGTVCGVTVVLNMDEISGWFWSAYEVALSAFESVIQAVSFIANPAQAIEFFANQLKNDAVGLFTRTVTAATELTSFDAQADWWRDAYAASAGIGLVVLAIMLLLTFHQSSTGKIGPEEAGRSILMYAPIAVLMMSMGPPVAWAIQWLADGLSAGIIDWMGPDTVTFLRDGAPFAAMTSDIPGGVVLGLLLYGLLFLAGIGTLGTFIVQTISVYIFGAVCGVGWGMAGNPNWRRKALRLPSLWVGLVLAKPAMLFVLGLVMKFAAAIDMDPDSTEDGMGSVVQALMVVLALMFVAFAPWMLLKWFPLLPDGSERDRSSRRGFISSAAGSAGSTLTAMAMMRARGHGSSPRSLARTDDPAPPPRPVAPTPAGAGAAGAGRGAQGAASVGARSGGSAAGSVGTAAAGAATGGALLAAQLAAGSAQSAVRKAREAAMATTPKTGGSPA
jgi:hypothetical protein